MTPARFAQVLAVTGWSVNAIARRLNYDSRTVARWRAGTMAVPPPAARWLEEMAALYEAAPPGAVEWARRLRDVIGGAPEKNARHAENSLSAR